MKHLLNGVAIAAALAIAAPAWAQAPMTPAGGKAASAAGAPMAAKQRHKRHAHAHMHRHGKIMAAGDMMTEQLNREELARLQGGGMPAGPAPTNAGSGQGGPRASGH